eukprot:TRINITY_DN7545_c0_g1_i1.p1 TRINITY_DN7545_c0_g1~~TRINITY_DN7545_c0_g1_i1.p1  ORF type:complete len:968 (-),score=301.05 TRINITY_DN7545_c0_g1_i1:52-2955(-)
MVKSNYGSKTTADKIAEDFRASGKNLEGSLVLVTGANTGIGVETSRTLASLGAEVVMACRNQAKGDAAVGDVRQSTGNNNVHMMLLDVSLMDSVRNFCKDFEAKFADRALDITICNAGVMSLPAYEETKDGFEMQWATNHLGHFLMVHLLLGMIKKSQCAKVITISSFAHHYLPANFDWEASIPPKQEQFQAIYAITKSANILHARELQRRFDEDEGVSRRHFAFSVNPGAVATELGRHLTGGALSFIFAHGNSLMKSPQQGAATTVFCAIHPDAQKTPGGYFSDCHETEKDCEKACKDMESASKLWVSSERMLGLTPTITTHVTGNYNRKTPAQVVVDDVRARGKTIAGKLVLITGGNTGIGVETAKALATLDAEIVITCRNQAKGEAAVAEIREYSKNTLVHAMLLDVSDLRSVRQFAKEFDTKFPERGLDIVINNAGVMAIPDFTESADGFEMQFATNHLGHFLMVNLLMDKIRKADHARVISVSSTAFDLCPADFDWEADVPPRREGYNMFRHYGVSKAANILFTKELQRKFDEDEKEKGRLFALCLHPGEVQTNLGKNLPSWLESAASALLDPMTPPQGATTSVYCAIHPTATRYPGGYFAFCKPADDSLSAQCKEMKNARSLWEISERLVGLKPRLPLAEELGRQFKDTKYGSHTTAQQIVDDFRAAGLLFSNSLVLITGANTGIGFETAKALASLDAEVVMACRNQERGEAAVADIRSSTKNNQVHSMLLDLSSLASVRNFAKDFEAKYADRALDITVCNAGVFALPNYEESVDGFEKQFAVNHLGHFLLVNLLMGMIKKSQKAKVVVVSSHAHLMAPAAIDWEVDVPPKRDNYHPTRNYAIAKSANILFVKELQRKFDEDEKTRGQHFAFCLHPGLVKTELGRHLGPIMSMALGAMTSFSKTPQQGASTSVFCAIHPDAEKFPGGYFADCHDDEKDCRKALREVEVASKFWALSERLTS